jgi:peptidoglycan/LPS O-acetylase OafA/YrhL
MTTASVASAAHMKFPEGHTTALDGIRGLAVLFVFMSHTSGRGMPVAPWLQFHGLGHIGVYLFFVLSGFLLTRNLLEGQAATQFYMRRFFRIAPLYFLVLAGVLVYQAVGYYSPRYLHISGSGEGALLHFLFLKGDGVFWTLAAEFAFYLMLPVIVVVIGRFGRKWLIIAAIGYFCWFYLIQVFGVRLPPPKFVEIGHHGQFLDVFACGILGAYYVRFKLPEIPVAAAFWGLLAFTLFFVSFNFLGAGQPWYGLRWLSLLYGIVFAAGVVSASQGNRWLLRPLTSKWLVFMGVTGFGWYLLHFPVIQVVNAYLDMSAVMRLLISTAACAAVAWVAFQLVERPGIRLGRRLERQFILGNGSGADSSKARESVRR